MPSDKVLMEQLLQCDPRMTQQQFVLSRCDGKSPPGRIPLEERLVMPQILVAVRKVLDQGIR